MYFCFLKTSVLANVDGNKDLCLLLKVVFENCVLSEMLRSECRKWLKEGMTEGITFFTIYLTEQILLPRYFHSMSAKVFKAFLAFSRDTSFLRLNWIGFFEDIIKCHPGHIKFEIRCSQSLVLMKLCFNKEIVLPTFQFTTLAFKNWTLSSVLRTNYAVSFPFL